MTKLGSIFVVAAASVWAQASAAGPEIRVLPVQGNVYMIVGAGGNITVQKGADGVLVVDTGLTAQAPNVLAAIPFRMVPSGTSSIPMCIRIMWAGMKSW